MEILFNKLSDYRSQTNVTGFVVRGQIWQLLLSKMLNNVKARAELHRETFFQEME